MADSEAKEQTNQEEQTQQTLKDPRDVTKRPPSIAAKGTGPAHTRAGQHGVRSTALIDSVDPETLVNDVQKEAHEEAQAEDFSRSSKRTTGAGPNPYGLVTSREAAGPSKIEQLVGKLKEDNPLVTEQQIASYIASSIESDAADAEVQTLGATVTDTGLKIRQKPDRVDAQERAILERKDLTHKAAIEKVAEEDPNTDYRVVAAHEEATAESDSELAADVNPGALYGGNAHDQVSR